MSRWTSRVLLYGLLTLGICPLARAEDTEEIESATDDFSDYENLDLEKLLEVYSAAKHAQDIGDSPSAIAVITREDIEASGADTLIDLLRMVPGLEVVISSPVYSSVNTRLSYTSDGQYFLVLIDGRETNQELLGYPPLEIQPCSLSDIERIEVIRGPGSALYGANAMAGVINITTRSIPDKTSGWVGISGGEIGAASMGARISSRFGDWGVSAGGGADFLNMFSNPREAGRRTWNFRSVAQVQWADKKRLLLDWGLAQGTGIVYTGMGPLNATIGLRMIRVAYESDALRAQLYWNQSPVSGELNSDLTYHGLLLAHFVPVEFDTHTFNGEVQWTLPRWWDPLLLIVGGGGRISYLTSDQLLDEATFPIDHVPGVRHFEERASIFFQGELTPFRWLTATAGLRWDWNSGTNSFLSPRLATVFRVAPDQFLRFSVSRAFRKPSFYESRIHLLVDIPKDSPFGGSSQESFLEFMTRVAGNSRLINETLFSIESGYMGRFLDDHLMVSLDLYYNMFSNEIAFATDMVTGPSGIPDITKSSSLFVNLPKDRVILGSELQVQVQPIKGLALTASWTLREIFDRDIDRYSDQTPKNLFTIGGRFTGQRMVASLYLFMRSNFWDRTVYNTAGLLDDYLHQYMPDTALVLARLGWRINILQRLNIETGVKIFLPISPFQSSFFRVREKGGGFDWRGANYGGDELRRLVTFYLEGSF